MIDQRVHWRHCAMNTGERMFPERAGIARAVHYAPAERCWHVLVEHRDGTFSDQQADNLEIDREPVASQLDTAALDDARVDLGNERDRVRRLFDYVVGEGLEESAVAALDPCASAIVLLRQFQTELLQASSERDAALKRADELAVELEAAKKRKPGRPAGRLPEHES